VVFLSIGAVWIVAALAMWLAGPRNSIEGTWETVPGPTKNVFRVTFSPGGKYLLAFNDKVLMGNAPWHRWSRLPGPAYCNREPGQRKANQFKLMSPDAGQTEGYVPVQGDIYRISSGMFFVLEDGRLLQNQGLVLERVTLMKRLTRWFRSL